jgi:hypothetical protein
MGEGVHGRAICIVIKAEGLRGEQCISLSKQRGKIWAFAGSKTLCDFAGKWIGKAGRA